MSKNTDERKQLTEDEIKELAKDTDNLFSGTDENSEYYKAITEMYDDEAFRTKSILGQKELKLITRFEYYIKEVNKFSPSTAETLAEIKQNYLHYTISIKGKGREQFFATLSALREGIQDAGHGIINRIFRR